MKNASLKYANFKINIQVNINKFNFVDLTNIHKYWKNLILLKFVDKYS